MRFGRLTDLEVDQELHVVGLAILPGLPHLQFSRTLPVGRITMEASAELPTNRLPPGEVRPVLAHQLHPRRSYPVSTTVLAFSALEWHRPYHVGRSPHVLRPEKK